MVEGRRVAGRPVTLEAEPVRWVGLFVVKCLSFSRAATKGEEGNRASGVRR